MFGISSVRISQIVKEEEEKQGIVLPVHESGFKKKTELDEYDFKIIDGLKKGLTYEQIRDKVGLSKSGVCQRVKRIERITGMTFPRNKKGLKRKTEPDEIDEEIIGYLEQELTQKQIAIKVGLAQATVCSRIKTIEKIKGIKFPRKQGRSVEIDETDKQIIEFLKQGLSYREIAEAQNVTISFVNYRIRKIEEFQGTKLERRRWIKKNNTDVLDDYINKQIIDGLDNGLNQSEIARNIGVTRQAISERKKLIDKEINKRLAKQIVKLIYTKHATIEQIKIIGEYYGVDVEEVINSLKGQER